MTTLASNLSSVRRIPRVFIDFVIGTLLCLSPLTAILVLGWMSRKMAARIDARLLGVADRPRWLLGSQDTGWFEWLFGGLAANIRSGIVTLVGLALLTLPFSVLWLGAWWGGWENSFNKGYEQSSIGPIVWFVGAAIALPILAHLPMALAHAASEKRFAAFFEWRRIRSAFRAAGWRVVWLALLTTVLSVPFFGMRALPVFVEGLVPGFTDMLPEDQLAVAQMFDLAGAALAFTLVLSLRLHAAAIYCVAAPRAAHGRDSALWDGHPASRVTPKRREPSRNMGAVWLLVSSVICIGIPAQIVVGQFMNYSPIFWLTHPIFLLPWAG